MADLEEERQFLLRSLDDLEDERAAGEISEKDYLELREAYGRRASETMRAISAGASGALVDVDDEEPPVDPRRRRMLRTVAAVVLVALVAGGAGALVASMAGERTPGQPSSGSLAGGSDRLSRARALMGEGKALEAIKLFDDVLKDDPANPEALAYRGWLLKLAGLWERGLESIEAAIAADPSYPDARFFRGMVLEQDKGDPAGAVVEFRAFLASKPPAEVVPMVEQVLQRAMKKAEEQGQAVPPEQPAS